VLAWLLPASARAEEIALPDAARPFDVISARDAGSGGSHAAYAGGLNVLFANPALLADTRGQLGIAELSFSLAGLGMAGVLINYLAKTGDPLPYLDMIQESARNAVDIGGPLAIGFVRKNWGAGLFNTTRMDLDWKQTGGFKEGSLFFMEEIVAAGAFGFRFFETSGGSGDAGIGLKLFFRGGNRPDVDVQTLKYFLENAQSAPYEAQLGAGLDLGLRFTVNNLSFGLALRDPFSPVMVTITKNFGTYLEGAEYTSGVVFVPPTLKAGLAWNPPPPFWRHIISGFCFTLDFKQALFFLESSPRHPLLELSAGFEMVIQDVYSFRMGLSDMLPAAGFGINFGLFHLDTACFMVEGGENLWERPTLAVNISVLYRYRRPAWD
jgi:hypothetical protein